MFTSLLSQRVAGTQMQCLPEAVKIWAKRAIADTIGCGLAGGSEAATLLLRDVLGTPPGPALAIGSSVRTHPLDAAQLSGAACHALDFDDCHVVLDGHPSVAIVPALFALADSRGLGGDALLLAYVTGVEAGLRLAVLSHPAHLDRGWHPTATLGVLGCAAACARLLELDAERTATALSIAASSASGLRANSGTMTKPLHAAMANRNGLQAALLAERGYTANTTALEHKFGYAAAFNGTALAGVELTLADWGEVFMLLEPGIAIKQYPCCAFIHSAIDAAAAIRSRLNGPADEIASIEVKLHGRRLRNIDRPRPKDGLDARFSTQYLTARALITGTVELGDFEAPQLANPANGALSQRVALVPHDEADLSLGHVAVTTRSGATFEASASVAMGRDPASR